MVQVSVSRHIIASNQQTGQRKPPIAILRDGVTHYASAVELIGAARAIYAPDHPLASVARVWIECDDAVAL